MAFMAHENPEEQVTCPFDDTHMVSRKIFQYHLRKCKKNYSHVDMYVCPFNARHVVDGAQLHHHKIVCPDRVYAEMQARSEESKEKAPKCLGGALALPDYSAAPPSPHTEDWGSETRNTVFIWDQTSIGDTASRPDSNAPLPYSTVPGSGCILETSTEFPANNFQGKPAVSKEPQEVIFKSRKPKAPQGYYNSVGRGQWK